MLRHPCRKRSHHSTSQSSSSQYIRLPTHPYFWQKYQTAQSLKTTPCRKRRTGKPSVRT
jgi:hypothetical protein